MVFGMFNTMLFTKPIGIIIWKLGANFKVVNLPRPQKQPNPLGSWVVSRYVPYIYTHSTMPIYDHHTCVIMYIYIYVYVCVCQYISPWSFSLKNKATTMSLLLPSRKLTMDDLPVKKWWLSIAIWKITTGYVFYIWYQFLKVNIHQAAPQKNVETPLHSTQESLLVVIGAALLGGEDSYGTWTKMAPLYMIYDDILDISWQGWFSITTLSNQSVLNCS